MMNNRKRTKLEPEPTFTLQSTTLEHEDSFKILRQRLSLGQLACDYIHFTLHFSMFIID